MGLKMRHAGARGLMGLCASLTLGLGSARAEAPAQRNADVSTWLAQQAVYQGQPVCPKAVACAAPRGHDCGEACAHSAEQCRQAPPARRAALVRWVGQSFEASLQPARKAAVGAAQTTALSAALTAARPEVTKALQSELGGHLGRYLKARGYDQAAAGRYGAARLQEASSQLMWAATLTFAPELEAALVAAAGPQYAIAKTLVGNSGCALPAVPAHVVKILGPHKKYLVAERDGRLNADRAAPLEWEHFELIEHPDGSISLKSFHGRYVVAQKNGQASANRLEISDWEKFRWVHNEDGTVSFLGFHGKYLVAEPRGQAKANRAKLDAWEKFRLIPAGQ